MVDMEISSLYCGGRKGCHIDIKTFDKDDDECMQCLKDAEDAILDSRIHLGED